MSDKMREALEQSAQGWGNVIELGLLPPQHVGTAAALRDKAREALAERPEKGEAVPDGMWKISKLIATLQSTHDRFGDTCVWMRECKWGAAALHAKSEAEAAPPAPAVPDGWKLVPAEATEAMVSAVRAGTIEPQGMVQQARIIERIKSDYRKLLTAAPEVKS